MIVNLFPMGEFELPYDRDLSKNTPAQIQRAVREGVASDLWSVGDKTAAITISSFASIESDSVCAFIIGFDHNSTIEGTGITFQIGETTDGTKVALVDSGYDWVKSTGDWFNMNNSLTNVGGWESSNMRTTICPAFFDAMPSEWQNVIASTTKYTDNSGGGTTSSSAITTTSDKIFLLSEWELFGARNSANVGESTYMVQYAYYSGGASIIKYKTTDTGSACSWYLRSAQASNSTKFCTVRNTGVAYSTDADYSLGFSPAFRVA